MNLVFAIGAGIGALVSGFLVNIVGRIRTVIIIEIIAIITLLGMLKKDIYMFMIVRFFSGFVSGVLVHTDMVINSELVPKSISPGSGVLFQGFITFGSLMTTVFAYAISPGINP